MRFSWSGPRSAQTMWSKDFHADSWRCDGMPWRGQKARRSTCCGLPSWELTYPLPKVLLKMILNFPKVGYICSVEGTCFCFLLGPRTSENFKPNMQNHGIKISCNFRGVLGHWVSYETRGSMRMEERHMQTMVVKYIDECCLFASKMLMPTQILVEMMPFDKQFFFSHGFFNHHYNTKKHTWRHGTWKKHVRPLRGGR